MGFGNRLWWCGCLLFASFLISTATATARNPFILSLSDEEVVTVTVAVAVESAAVGRRLKALSTDDYNDPSANRGHDPRNRIGGGGWKVRQP